VLPRERREPVSRQDDLQERRCSSRDMKAEELTQFCFDDSTKLSTRRKNVDDTYDRNMYLTNARCAPAWRAISQRRLQQSLAQ